MKQYPDDLIRGFDRALRTLTGQHQASRPSPATNLPGSTVTETGSSATNDEVRVEVEINEEAVALAQQADRAPEEPVSAGLTPDEKRHAAGLMRVNHCGEVCAQALYDGQSVTARSPEVLAVLAQAGAEEIDHLVWCEQRLDELDARPSVLNPLFYAASWTLGAVAGLLGDRVSLAFVEATEDQVVKHLDSHLESLPAGDDRSRAVVAQMRADEARHGDEALELAQSLGSAGEDAAADQRLSPVQKRVMAGVARLMTATTYRI